LLFCVAKHDFQPFLLMNSFRLFLFAAFFPFAICAQSDPPLRVANNYLRYVNPFVGTGGHGHTYPGATAPFGMVQLSPDTRLDMMDWDGCSGYHYSDSLIYGFSHTHLSGTGVADYCDILFMPFSSGVALKPTQYASPFKKSSEKAEAGYYSVFLEKDRILAELTATERVGVHRYTFPKNKESGSVLIDLRHRDEVLDAHLKVINDREIAGYRVSKAWAKEQHVYFVARFSQPFSSSIILDMSKNPIEAQPSVTSKAIVGLLDFAQEGVPVVVTVGISGTSIEGARKNLEEECRDFDFDRVRAQTQLKWQRQLAKIEVEGDDEEQKTIFYTALYHTMIAPNIWSDVDRQYRGRDGKIHQAKGHDVYTVFSLWDTYRACNPLYTIIEPNRSNDFIQTFLRQYEQGGLLPIWELAANETDCMIGNHAIPVIADAYAKGIRDYDANLALEAMIKSASQDRYGMKWYRELGYIPSDKESESVSKTLEYSYDDWCIAEMADQLGKKDISESFLKRSHHFIQLFDPETRFFRAKNNGRWQTPFDPFEVNFHFTEANAWQYSLAAPHAISDASSTLSYLYDDQITKRLDELFSANAKTTGRNQADITGLIGQYVHGNEPSHHMAYLYRELMQPWKTEERVHQIMNEMYHNRPDGLSGNEDCGQMSAWYVLSALGFYPVTPGLPVYTLGTPLFPKVTIRLENGNRFTIEAKNLSKSNFYVNDARISGNDIFTRISHFDILNGGKLVFDMSNQPRKNHMGGGSGFSWPVVPLPYARTGQRTFEEETVVRLECLEPKVQIYYTLDGSTPSTQSSLYTKPFVLKQSAVLHMISVLNGKSSAVETASFYKIPGGMKVLEYKNPFSPQYTANGMTGLIDGIRGSKTDFRTGDWQGFEGKDLNMVIDLGASRKINRVSTGFFQDENAWIFFPTKMTVEISENGKDFTPAGEVVCRVLPSEKGTIQQDFSLVLNGKKGRYLRVVGVNMGQCPDWHKGRGFSSWVFADEVVVE
jgi:predicted alpha-1,2-mannosidase